jgi:hypothetical protein
MWAERLSRAMRAGAACVAIALLIAAARARAAEKLPQPSTPEPPSPLRLEIEAPVPNAVIGAQDGKLMVSGRALADPARDGRFDVMLVVDTSSSTLAPAGADIDGDGLLGDMFFPILARLLPLPSTDPGDSVLAAEVAAARTLLEQLDSASTRVGVISFAGDRHEKTPDARVVVPLDDEHPKVDSALDALLAKGARGQTNMQSAVLLAAQELSGGRGALSRPRPDARKIALLMTDGDATLPDRTSRARCARLAILAAALAADHGIRIDTFAVGPGAAERPVTAEVARVTRGVLTSMENASDLIAAFQELRLTAISEVQVENLTTPCTPTVRMSGSTQNDCQSSR